MLYIILYSDADHCLDDVGITLALGDAAYLFLPILTSILHSQWSMAHALGKFRCGHMVTGHKIQFFLPLEATSGVVYRK